MNFLRFMIVPCKCCLLLELSVSAALAHAFGTLVEFTAFFTVFICHTNRTHSMPSTFGFLHKSSEADCL